MGESSVTTPEKIIKGAIVTSHDDGIINDDPSSITSLLETYKVLQTKQVQSSLVTKTKTKMKHQKSELTNEGPDSQALLFEHQNSPDEGVDSQVTDDKEK